MNKSFIIAFLFHLFINNFYIMNTLYIYLYNTIYKIHYLDVFIIIINNFHLKECLINLYINRYKQIIL